MAPQPSNQKRKRAGAPDASDQGSAVRDSAEPKRFSKRRKAAEQSLEEPKAAEKQHGEATQAKKRGRPNRSPGGPVREAAASTAAEPTQPRKRGRPSAGGTSTNDEAQKSRPETSMEVSSPRRSRRERQKDPSQDIAEPQEAPSRSGRAQKAAKGPPKRQGRPSLAGTPENESRNRDAPADKEDGRRKRGRRIDAESKAPDAEPKPEKRKRSNNDQADGRSAMRQDMASKESKPSQQPKGKKRRRSGPSPRRSGVSTPGSDGDADTEGQPRPFRHLVARERQIPRSVISAKWTPLDEVSIGAVDALLTYASRPVLLRLRDNERRRALASGAIERVSRRVRSKLAKGMPFPPSLGAAAVGGRAGREEELVFERTVDAIQALEGQLDPLLHSVAVLKREREKEDESLERDYGALRILEGNAKSEARAWKERGRRGHVLVPDEARKDDSPAGNGLEIAAIETGGAFENLENDISRQVNNHMDSMRSNLQQVEGVVPAITQSRAVLQRVLSMHLNAQQYGQVVVG